MVLGCEYLGFKGSGSEMRLPCPFFSFLYNKLDALGRLCENGRGTLDIEGVLANAKTQKIFKGSGPIFSFAC